MRKVEASTWREGKVHWTELELEVEDDSEAILYHLSVVGCTSVEGEWEHVKNKTCHSAEELVETLRDGNGHLSMPAMELLGKANIHAGSRT